MIHGYCKYQDKGCLFSHPQPPSQPTQDQSQSQSISTLPVNVNAPVFVPKALASIAHTQPSPPPEEYQEISQDPQYDPYPYPTDEDAVAQQMEQMDPHFYDDAQYAAYQSGFDPNPMDPYYASGPPVFVRQPLNYHLYTPTPLPTFTSPEADTHFVPPSSQLRELLQKRNETIRGIAPIGTNLPEELQGYHTLVPLEAYAGTDRRKLGNWFSVVYRAIRSSDGMPYALRRVENFRLTHQSAFAPIEVWSNLHHPNIVSVKEAFTTRSFSDNSLVVVYAYHPDAQTLYEAHLKPKAPTMQKTPYSRSTHLQVHHPTQIPERTIWSYIVQIASAIKKVHDAGQAVRMVDVSKVLLTGQNRVRISSCGIVEVMIHDPHQVQLPDLALHQQEDLTMFGRLVFALCCGNVAASSPQNFQKSLDAMGRSYSPDMKHAALFLISKGGPHRNIDQLLDNIRGKVLIDLEDAMHATDRLENELMGELENARLVRLLCKFGFINERPEFAREPRWSETGDRYIIKLFRDYVFHQVDELNNPVVNLSHVLTCLNKLDVGTDEKIMLVSRDEQSCLVVSYKEIKQCIESAFSDLANAQRTMT